MSYDEKTKKGLFRLAHFHPNFEDKYGNQVVDYLVLDALNIYETENQVTPEEICRVINSTHNLAFEESEIETSARRLNESEYVNLIEPHKRGQTPKFSITKNIKEKIDTNLVEVRRLENKVFSEWEEELKEKYDETKVLEVIDELIENFQGFLTKLFIRHGIQCVSLLYPDQIKEKGWWKKTRSNIINELPTTNPFINTLLDFEIPIFFNSENLNRIKYLTTLFTSSFYWHLIQVDHDCSRLFQEVTQGQKLFLDNNILYNMVGLNGDYLLRGIHNLLKNAKKLGYEIWVTEKTIEEFHASLDYKKNEIKKHPGLPKEFARLASDNLSADNPLVIYWKEYVNSGKSVDEFISERSHIESILNDFEINITDEFHDEINHSDELQYEMDLLREACGSYFNDNIVEHDAFHRIFIKRIRGSIKKHFVEAGAWFLTNDGKLPVYSNYAVEDSKELSFCILVDQWVQINRPMLMRVDGEPQYEKTFHSLVVQPYVRAFISSDNLANVMNFILSRVEKYEHMSPKLALEIITDREFIKSLIEEENEEEKEQRIDRKVVALASKLNDENELLRKELNESNKEIRENRRKLEALEQQNVSKDKSLSYFEEELSESKNLIEQIESDKSEEIETLKSENEKIKSTNLWILFSVSLLLLSLFIWFQPLLFSWAKLENYNNEAIVRLSTNLAILFCLLNIPLPKYWLTWVSLTGGVIFVLLGILAI